MGPLVVWWLVLEGLGLIALPLTFRLFSARAGHGYTFGKLIALLLISYVAWSLGSAGMPYHLALAVGVGGFVALNAALGWYGRDEIGAWLRTDGPRVILTHDAFWTFGFLFFAWQRSLGPEIFGAEKYMDFAFFNTLTRTDVMPPQDPWMSGQTFNYYYFGYLMFANLARLSPIPNHIAYNLCVATAGGLGFGQMSAIGLTLTRRLSFGFLTGVVTMILGNLDGFLQLIEKGGFVQFDYWRSSRIVAKGDTINEFPYFTTIHGDLHPHFIVLPVTALLLALLLDPERFLKRSDANGGMQSFRDLWAYVPVTFVLASMIVISPWELPVGAMVTFLLLARPLPLRSLLSLGGLRTGLTVVGMLVAGYVLYLPFYLHFAAPTVAPGPNEMCVGSACVKVAQTSLAEFLTVFGALLFPAALFLGAESGAKLSLTPEKRQLLVAAVVLVTVIALLAGNAVLVVLIAFIATAFACAYASEDSERRAPILLLVAASAALLACELVYIKDPYGEKLYRMNTVFKLYFEAWLLLSIAAPWCWAQLLEPKWLPARARSVVLLTVGALFLASCAYPIGITATRLRGRFAPVTLDGTEYLSREHPDDFAAIRWVRENVTDLPVVLEATENPYSYYARFSSNTGLPTVMGWANHEGLWRSHEPGVEQRKAEVIRMYKAPTLEEITPLLDRYHVKFVIVGELERKDYGSGVDKFQALHVAFARGGTTVYER